MLGVQAYAGPAGSVVPWGDQVLPVVQPGTRFTAIAAGWDHNLALKPDGTVVAWGNNDYGESTVPAGLSNIVAISGGGEHSLGLMADGTVVAWGYNSAGSTIPVGLSNVIA